MGDHLDEVSFYPDQPTQRHARRLPNRFETKVVGVSFRPSYPRSVRLLADLVDVTRQAQADDTIRPMLNKQWQRIIDRTLVEGAVPIRLVREPDNEFDPCAVQVWVPFLECGALGYIPASSHGAVNKLLARSMDAGHHWSGWVQRVRIHPDHLANPGIDIVVQRATEGEQGP